MIPSTSLSDDIFFIQWQLKEIDRPELDGFRRKSLKNAPIVNKTIVNNLLSKGADEDEGEQSLPYPLPPTDGDFLKSFVVEDVSFAQGDETEEVTRAKMQDANFDKYYASIDSSPASPWVSTVGAGNIQAIKDRFLINDKWIEDPQQEAIRHYCTIRSPNPSYCGSADVMIPLAKNITVLTRDGFVQRKWRYPYGEVIDVRADPTIDNADANVHSISNSADVDERLGDNQESPPKKKDEYRYKPQEISIAVGSNDGRLLLLGSTVYGINVDPNPSADLDVDSDPDGLNAMVGCCSVHDSVDGRLVVMLSQDVRGGVVAGAFNNTNSKVVIVGGGLVRSLHIFAW